MIVVALAVALIMVFARMSLQLHMQLLQLLLSLLLLLLLLPPPHSAYFCVVKFSALLEQGSHKNFPSVKWLLLTETRKAGDGPLGAAASRDCWKANSGLDRESRRHCQSSACKLNEEISVAAAGAFL